MINVRLDFDKRTKEIVISLMSFFVLALQVVFKAGFSLLETSLASFEISDANALRYCSFMLHQHHIIAIITNLLSKVTYNTFFGVFTLDCFAEQNLSRLEFCLASQCKNTQYFLSVSPRKEMGPHGEREKKSLTDPNQRPPEKITVALPTELQGQMGADRGKLRWQFAVNEHVSEGVTIKVWPLSTIKHIE